ncbi:MAG: associated domain protein, partial [Polaromonas sp.]|nr:associated domain protein [Polaromonas sp.]
MSTGRRTDRAASRKALDAWFAARGWKPFGFQREVWRAVADGRSGLLHATTGAGKTYAVWLAALMAFMTLAPVRPAPPPTRKKTPGAARPPPGVPLTVLWITPMRALAADTLRALQQPLDALQAAPGDGPDRPA